MALLNSQTSFKLIFYLKDTCIMV